MTYQEANYVKSILLRIKYHSDAEINILTGIHPKVKLAIAYLDKEIAIREAQSKAGKEDLDSSRFYGL